MAPTIQSGAAADRDRKQRPGEKKSDLVCRIKYCNTLPDIPFDPKFITYPFLPNRFVDYKPTSLERNYKHDLLTEHDLGVSIDLINPDTYAVDPNAVLHPDDEKLLEEDTLTPQDSKRSRHHNKTVPWLKKTEYISNEFNRYGNIGEKTETKVGYNVKKLFKEENMYMDRESQINAINKTFSDAKAHVEKHYSKPGVVPVEIMPVFPDFDLWKYPFAQVMFDTDPALPTQMEEMSHAMIRGVMDESGEQFVAYFLPTEETMKKRKRDKEDGVDYVDEEEYEYKMAREYNWNVKNKATKGYEENYFFVFRDGNLYYNELETRVRLSKRRLKPGIQPNNSRLVVQHRPLNEVEHNQQSARLSQLDALVAEEEEEMETEVAGDKETEEEEKEVEENEEEEQEEAENEASDAEEHEEKEDEASSDREVEQQSDKSGSEDEGGEEADQQSEKSGSEDEAGEKQSEKSGSEDEGANREEKEQSSAKSSSSSEQSSDEEEDDEDEEARKKKRDEEEIFGSDSD